MSDDTKDLAPDGCDDELAASSASGQARLQTWWAVWQYARHYPATLWGIGACAILTALLDVSFPLVTMAVIDEVAEYGLQADLMPLALLYLLLTVTLALIISAFVRLCGQLHAKVSHDIRQAGFANLQKLSFSYYDHRPVGWLMARMTSDCHRLSDIMAWGFLDLVWSVTAMLCMTVIMLMLQPTLALTVLAVLPLLAWLSIVFEKHLLSSARHVRAKNSRLTASYNEAITGVMTSKAFVCEDRLGGEFASLAADMRQHSVRNHVQAALYLPLVVTLGSLAVGLTLALGGSQLLAGTISAGTLVAFLAYGRQLFEPIENLAAWFAELQMAQASAERILSLIEEAPEIQDSAAVQARLAQHDAILPASDGAQDEAQDEARDDVRDDVKDGLRDGLEADPGDHARDGALIRALDGDDAVIERIDLRNVSFSYSADKPALADINLTIHRGETVAFVGATGGGKSTLVNLICRFYEPVEGQVLINGKDYRERSLDWLHSTLGIVLQDAHLFRGTVGDNIRYGDLTASPVAVADAARLSGADEFIATLPQGYDTPVGERGNRLSTGQKQLVSLARAILADPQILVMDEATSSVDTQTEHRIQQAMQAVLRDRTALVIAHRLSTIRQADRIVVINQGRIEEQGTHRRLLAAGGRYSKLCRLQQLNDGS